MARIRKTASDDGIFAFEPTDRDSKAILKYLSRNKKQKDAFAEALKSCGSDLVTLTGEKIETTANTIEGEENLLDIENCIRNFISHFSSWNEKLENASNSDTTNIISLLSEYRDRCFGNWYKDSSMIFVTGPKYIVAEVKRKVTERLAETPASNISKAESFEYSGVHPAILRFITKQQHFKYELTEKLRSFADIEIKEREGEVHISPNSNSFEQQHSEFEKRCNSVLQQFFDRFSTWKEKFDPNAIKDRKSKDPDLFKPNTYPDHFVKWFYDTGVVLVTGTKEQVERCKHFIRNLFETPVHSHPQETTEAGFRSRSSSVKAHSFAYPGVPPAILRFITNQQHFKSELTAKLRCFADIEMTENKGNWEVQISPNYNSWEQQHSEFERRCKAVLQQFFDRFSFWKERFDPNDVKDRKSKTPDRFKPSSYPDHFVKWFYDTGVVMVTGTREQVERCKHVIRDMFANPSRAPAQARTDTDLPMQVGIPTYDASGKMKIVLLQGLPSQFLSTIPTVVPGQNQIEPGSQSPLSPSSIEMRPMTSRPGDILFDTRNIRPAIRKFILNDLQSKNELDNCGGGLAKVFIKSDLTVRVIFRQKPHAEQNKEEVFAAVQKFFEKFDSQKPKFDKKRLENALAYHHELFDSKNGLYILALQERGTVQITGNKEKVLQKVDELDHKINSDVERETLPIDVFIAQRECGVWRKVEEICRSSDGFKISITPAVSPGEIQYEGRRNAIDKAKVLLGKVSEELFEKEPERMSENDLEFLKKCGDSQKRFPETTKNMLDSVYKKFKEKSINGSLAFKHSRVYLISSNSSHWLKGNELLRQMIASFDVDVSDKIRVIPFTKLFKNLKTQLNELPTFVAEKVDSKKFQIVCFKNQETEMKDKVHAIIRKACDIKVMEKFYPMPIEMANHISKHGLYKAKSARATEQDGKSGLLVKCEEEDLDTVEMKLEDFELESVKTEEKIPGYSLYEHLCSTKKHFKVESETKCSIFLKRDEQFSMPRKTSANVSVKLGNILDEKCDAIVNSTSQITSFSGQVSQAICGRHGPNILADLMPNLDCVIKDQVALCITNDKLPWQYIFNVATPGVDKIENFILNLLEAADKRGIRSMALPTIGTGGLGMDPNSVAKCMNQAFRRFCSGNVSHLRDISVVVYETSLLPTFQDIVQQSNTTGEISATRSSGLIATIYGASEESIQKAVKKLNEICSSSIETKLIDDPAFSKYTILKNQAQTICLKHDVCLQWVKNGMQEQCQLQGILENVRKADDDIKKLLEADIPFNWAPMKGDKPFVRVRLQETSDEYSHVERKFRQSSPQYSRIVHVERIQNPDNYKLFKKREANVQRSNAKKSVTNELFHGTRADKVDKICATGFDRNFAGENGTVYGRGVYFAVNSSYSVSYAGNDAIKHIFLAEVITGDYTQGSSEFKAPPPKKNGALYDSLVNNISNPTIYVVFRDSSVYPTYLITFT